MSYAITLNTKLDYGFVRTFPYAKISQNKEIRIDPYLLIKHEYLKITSKKKENSICFNEIQFRDTESRSLESFYTAKV